MAASVVRIGITGCGHAARVHLSRLLRLDEARVVGCADTEPAAAQALATSGVENAHGTPAEIPVFADHRQLIRQAAPDVLAIFTPHMAHYRAAMDALQAGCHVFVEKPLSTNVQEAVDIVGLARGRDRKVGVGHQYRLRPSLALAREKLAAGAIGPLHLVIAALTQPWLAAHGGAENAWRFDPKLAGGGILSDSGDQLLDTLLWTTGRQAVEATALQTRLENGLDLVTAAAVRLAGGAVATIAVSGVSPGSLFELTFLGERGRLRATDQELVEELDGAPTRTVTLPEAADSIDGNFVAAIAHDAPLCCPAAEAVDTVRLLDAIARSATSGEAVRLG